MCRSSEHRVLADRDTIRRELEALWQFHLKRLRTGAPIAQLFDRAIFSQDPPLQVVQCDRCGLVFRNPRERADEILEKYEEEAPGEEALASLFDEQLAFYRPRAARLTGVAGRVGSVLEVGSYVGGFLRAAAEAGWRASGIDVNAHASAFARAHGCAVQEAALHEFETHERYRAVVLWNCFDQLPEPHAALAKVSSLLDADGIIGIRVPNGAFYAYLHGRKTGVTRGMLAWNNLASFPYRHGFTLQSLELLLAEHGFTLLDRRGDTLVSIASAYTHTWARWEERFLKSAMRALLPVRLAPWLEIYARRNGPNLPTKFPD